MQGASIPSVSPTIAMTRRGFLRGAAGALPFVLGMPSGGAESGTARRPNIVLIYADDLDFDGVPGCDAATMPCSFAQRQGGAAAPTDGPPLLMPALQRLVTGGTRFGRFYVTSTVCTPSRYSLLTGRYASRCPEFVRRNPAGTHATIRWDTPIEDTETTLPKALQAAGYATGMVGKWHNFPGLGGRLNDRRFAEDADPRSPEIAAALQVRYDLACEAIRACGFDSVASVHIGNTEQIRPKALRGHNPEWVAAGARRFIEANRHRPFFLYMALTLPHGGYNARWLREADPLATTAGMLETLPDSGMPSRAEIFREVREAGLDERLAMGTWLDASVGAVLERLDDLGLTEDTLVLFVSDHQGRGKYTCYESARVPAVAHWPGRIAAGRRLDSLCANLDVAATLLELAGGERPADMGDGRSFLPLLLGQPEPAGWREALLLEVGNTRAVVGRRWKYIANRVPPEVAKSMAEDAAEAARDGRRRMVGWDGAKNWHPWQQQTGGIVYNSDGYYPHYFAADQLYDLDTDVLEQRNLAALPEHAGTLAGMKAELGRLLAPLPHRFGEFGP